MIKRKVNCEEVVYFRVQMRANEITVKKKKKNFFPKEQDDKPRAAYRAVAYYNSWESGQQNHADAIKGMNQEFARMKATLDAAPHDAFGWAILGALHIRISF